MIPIIQAQGISHAQETNDVSRLSAYNSLEMVYLFRPFGLPIGVRENKNIVIETRDGAVQELLELTSSPNKLLLYICTPQQYVEHQTSIHRFMESHHGTSTIGFFLVEDPNQPATIRLRKRLQQSSVPPWLLGDLHAPYTFNQFWCEIHKTSQLLFASSNLDLFNSMLVIREIEAKSLNEIGQAVMSQSSIDELMRLILAKAVELANADAGFLLLGEHLFAEPARGENDVKLLRRCGTKFVQKARICKSQKVRLKSTMLDPESGALTSLVVNRQCGIGWARDSMSPILRDLHPMQYPEIQIPEPDLEFDNRTYALKSFCTFPLRTPTQEVVGLILLVNRKTSSGAFLDKLDDVQNYVSAFTSHDLNLLEALSNQAGVSIDHARLYKDLRTVLESFVAASVIAIESRDPTTKGHSERVATLTMGLAEAVNQCRTGKYASTSFNASQLYELKYAALLHDFGKIGVREDILMKERKLFPVELLQVKTRFIEAEKNLQIKVYKSYIEQLMATKKFPQQEDYARINRKIADISSTFSDMLSVINDANDPDVVSVRSFQRIAEIAALQIENERIELLTTDEVRRLSIQRGSLSLEERREIESHVEHSYRFLLQIPWTSELGNIPEIVYAHHERLNGTGYPRGVRDEDGKIPLQAKIMAIADIYDALVSMDRPYKKSIPLERALSILEAEVEDGKLDRELFRIFSESRVVELVSYPGQDDAIYGT